MDSHLRTHPGHQGQEVSSPPIPSRKRKRRMLQPSLTLPARTERECTMKLLRFPAIILLLTASAAHADYPWTPFARVTRPPVPQVQNQAWVRNPIDAFLAAEHEARGLKP